MTNQNNKKDYKKLFTRIMATILVIAMAYIVAAALVFLIFKLSFASIII